MRVARRVLGLLAVAVAAGCGGGDPFDRQPVSGTVNVKGKPLEYGQIFFEPAAGQKFSTNAVINDGKFALAKDAGLSPGRYRYRLQPLDKNEVAPTSTLDTGTVKTGKGVVVLAEKDKTGEFEVKAGAENKLDIVIP